MARKKSSGKSSGKKKGVKLRTPKHGGGKLQVGNPGNSGGGRPRNEARRLFRGDALMAREKVIELIEARGECEECGRPKLKIREIMLIFDKFARYGFGPAKASVDPGLMQGMAESVKHVFGDEADTARMEELYNEWAVLLGEHAAGS